MSCHTCVRVLLIDIWNCGTRLNINLLYLSFLFLLYFHVYFSLMDLPVHLSYQLLLTTSIFSLIFIHKTQCFSPNSSFNHFKRNLFSLSFLSSNFFIFESHTNPSNTFIKTKKRKKLKRKNTTLTNNWVLHYFHETQQ